MSLDLSNRAGFAWNVALSTDASAVVAATFNGGAGDSAAGFMLRMDTSSGDLSLDGLPTSLTAADGAEMLEDGVRMSVVHDTVDSNHLTFTDPISSRVAAFVNRQDERICLTFSDDGSTRQWLFV